MKDYDVKLPISGLVVVSVKADSPEDAEAEALSTDFGIAIRQAKSGKGEGDVTGWVIAYGPTEPGGGNVEVIERMPGQ